MYRDNANQEYRPTFVYSRRKRGALRRLTPAGWLAVFVTAAVVVFGIAGVVRGLAVRAEGWGTASTIPTRSALAVAGAKSAPALPEAPEVASPGVDARTPTPTAERPRGTATPQGGVWWTEQMTTGPDGALTPPEAVQEEIRQAWEAYWARMSLPLTDLLPSVQTVEVMTGQYAMTHAFAERTYQNIVNEHRDKALATGRILTVQGDRVNLRAGPGTEYDAVGTAVAGTRLNLLEEVTGGDGKTWYRAWLKVEAREVWVASWLVRAEDNAWPYPQYGTHEYVFACAADGLSCALKVTMTDGGTGYYNLHTGEQGFLQGETAPFPSSGIQVEAQMVYDEEQERWLVDGISWEKLTS